MHFSAGEDWILSVHQFIEEYSQGIGVIADIM